MEKMEVGRKLWMVSGQPDRTFKKIPVVVSDISEAVFYIANEETEENIALCDNQGRILTCRCKARTTMNLVFFTEEECDSFLKEAESDAV